MNENIIKLLKEFRTKDMAYMQASKDGINVSDHLEQIKNDALVIARLVTVETLSGKLPEDIERKAKAERLWNDVEKLMSSLYCRWSDESQYEDINDYAVNIKPQVEAIGGKFIGMNKRPFGFTYELGGVKYQVTMCASKYAYRKIA